jgi:hypothetical protein
MKQLLQNLGSGKAELAEIPAPKVRPGHLLIRTIASLVSSGTERSVVELGQASLLQKARKQPEKVFQVLDKVKNEGLFQISTLSGKNWITQLLWVIAMLGWSSKLARGQIISR